MTIAVVAPEKFALQDLVCVELGLALAQAGLASLHLEPKDGEDATLLFAEDGPIEVQVKGARGAVTVAGLAEHLAHYPDRKAKNALLQRLLDDPSRCALFVMSGRCADALSSRIISAPVNRRPASRGVKKALAGELQAALAGLAAKRPKPDSVLERNRKTDIARLAGLPLTVLRDALSRIFIIECETAQEVEVRLHARLKSERIDTGRLRGGVAQLTDRVAAAKREQTDALAPMRRVLADLAPARIAPLGYVDRGAETHLLAELDQAGALLLVGPPRAGKSWTARALAGRLQARGFEVRQGGHVDEAERFLTDPIGVERAYLLDDPLGSREAEVDAHARLAALRSLLANLGANRRLIVAQAEPVLLSVTGTGSVTACGFANWRWSQLQPLDAGQAEAVWRAAAGGQRLSAADVDRVSALLHRGELRSPGALAYLAQTFDDLPSNASEEEIVLQSQRDARDFARRLAAASPEIAELLAAAAVATSPDEGTGEGELAFIIGGGPDRPGLESDDGVMAFQLEPPPAPSYVVDPKLTREQLHALEALQRRRVLEPSAERVNFSHPYLRAGAQALIEPDIPRDLPRIIDVLERGVACLSPATSLAAARNLRWAKRLVVDASGGSATFAVARRGMRSIFPATRDACFAFLMEHADALSRRMQERIPRWSESAVVHLDEIIVDRGVAFIGPRQFFAPPVPIAEVAPYLKAIEQGHPIGLDLAIMRRILWAARANPDLLTAAIADRLLRADEAVVRAETARLWCVRARSGDDAMLGRLADDAVPAVAVALLKAATRAWPQLEAARRDALLGVLRRHAESQSCASVLFHRLVLFNREEHFGSDPPWTVFLRLMPIILRTLPLEVSFNGGRFNAAVDSAVAVGSVEDLVPLLEAWGERLVRRLQEHQLNEFDIAVVDPLVAVAPPVRRLPLLRQLLGCGDTGVRVVTAAALAGAWAELDGEERKLLIDCLSTDHDDVVWLKAVVLAGRAPPAELVALLGGRADLLSLPADEIETALGPDLFAACVRTFIGAPQPLWWFGQHHRNEEVWRPVTRWLATRPSHPLHAGVFRELVSFDEPAELERVVTAVPEQHLDQIFEELLEAKLAITGEWRTASWIRLLERGRSAGRLEVWLKRIESVLEGVLEDLRDLREWLGRSEFSDRLLQSLSADLGALQRIAVIETAGELIGAGEDAREPLQAALASLLAEEMSAIRVAPPRLFGTWSRIGDRLKTLGANAATLAAAEEGRLAALDQHRIVTEHAGEETEKIQRWNEVARVRWSERPASDENDAD